VTITLINTTRRMQVINLPHDFYCATAGTCVCAQEAGRGGRRIPSSLTLPAGSVTTGLDEALLHVPEIIRGLSTGELRVRREPCTPTTNLPRKASRRTGRKHER